MRITAHNILPDSIYEFLPSKYSIFLSSSTHESVNTLRQSNWCVLSLMILYHVTALGSISNSRSFYTSKCNLMLLHVTYHINPLNAITLYLRYTNMNCKTFWKMFKKNILGVNGMDIKNPNRMLFLSFVPFIL